VSENEIASSPKPVLGPSALLRYVQDKLRRRGSSQ